MKKFLLLIAFAILTIATAAAQPAVDVLYLKNGSIIRGQVVEFDLEHVKIKTADGSLFVYSMSEVRKMEKESQVPESPAAPVVQKPRIKRAEEAPKQKEETPKQKEEGVAFALRGGIFANFEIWDQLKDNPDSKIGIGLMGTLTAGIDIDQDMYVGAGPHIGGNFWTQSKKVAGYETRTTVNVMDLGANLVFGFDDMYFIFGFGSADVSVTATVGGDSKTIEMPESAPYKRVTLGWGDGLGFGISYVSYSDWAKYLSRFEINLAFTF